MSENFNQQYLTFDDILEAVNSLNDYLKLPQAEVLIPINPKR